MVTTFEHENQKQKLFFRIYIRFYILIKKCIKFGGYIIMYFHYIATWGRFTD